MNPGFTIVVVLLLAFAAFPVVFWGVPWLRQLYKTEFKAEVKRSGRLIAVLDVVWILAFLLFTTSKDAEWLLIGIPALALRGLLFRRRRRGTGTGTPTDPPSE